MGEIEGCSQTGGLLPNGLMPNARPLIDSLDSERWLKAEERTAELITCIQPNQPSEERRNAVADYVQRLIMNIFPCQVFTFGSVPLKTYLPDGDIDLTAFSNNPNLKDSWASEVVDLLQTEEKNENAEFHVKEVQYIQAEVKIIKCFVENIVVDISFNQLGGLCTLCFLEEIDNLINQNHLFKRSIILIKAWCYYESRILGAHHGLISTYALETLVLYIFHVFNNSFAGPLEVLYRFLEFFSKFDWDNFCVSLWGPVPINSLPDVTAEPPRKDSGELLLNKVFLDACSSVYAVFPGGQDTLGQPFLSKHFNVIDPLRVSNNLGRSVSKGNFFRIRSAFAYGAKTLARLLDCPKENLVTEINQFFTNTWDRHGNGIRPDAPVTDLLILTQVSDSSSKKSELIDHETDFNDTHSSNYQSESSPKIHANRGQQNLKSGLLVNDIQRSPFARTRSSPELTDTYKYVPFQGTRNKPSENEKNHNRRKNIEPENEKNNPSSLQHAPPHQSFEASNIEPNIYPREDMNQEEQDLVNMMASSQFHGYNGPVNLASGHLPFPIPASFLASLGYTQRNFPGIIPTNMPFIDPQFPGMQFPHGLVPHYFPGVGMNSKPEDSVDQCNENNLADDSNSNHDFMNSEIVPQDDKPQSSSTGMSYVPPPRRVGGSGGLVRSQPKNSKEKHEQLTDNNHLDHNFQYSDERATISRFSSESSWDEISSTVIKSSKEKRGKKMVNRIDDGMQSEDDDQEWVRVRVPSVNLTSDSESQTVAQTSGSGPVIPMGRMGPMIIGSNPRQRMMDNSGGTSLTFYPTGPPVPFLTMLPFYNVPSENGVDQSDISQNFHSEHQSEEFSLRETPDGNKSDILNSDFASHWHNLQFGRFCQSPRHHGGPTGYPSPVLVPPVYLQGRVPWDGPGRPMPNVTQIMNYGPRLVPVAPLQSVPNRPLNVYQHYVEDMPRYRSGTGTYLPNPKVGGVRERPRRGNYNYEKSDNNGDREGNWTVNSKSRGNGRNHNHNQMDKSTTNRLGSSVSQAMNSNSHRQHDSFSGSSQSGPSANMVYGMYPSPGVSNNGLNGPAVVMEYPYEQNASFAPQSEQQQLEFRSFGSGGYSGINEQQSPRGSSPDQSSSPHHHRRV